MKNRITDISPFGKIISKTAVLVLSMLTLTLAVAAWYEARFESALIMTVQNEEAPSADISEWSGDSINGYTATVTYTSIGDDAYRLRLVGNASYGGYTLSFNLNGEDYTSDMFFLDMGTPLSREGYTVYYDLKNGSEDIYFTESTEIVITLIPAEGAEEIVPALEVRIYK